MLDQLSLSRKDFACININADINAGKKRCGAAKHFLEFWTSESKFDNLKI